MDQTRIDAVTHECLEACYQSLQPLNCLTNYAAWLRADPGWQENEIQEFERTAKRMLYDLLDA